MLRTMVSATCPVTNCAKADLPRQGISARIGDSVKAAIHISSLTLLLLVLIFCISAATQKPDSIAVSYLGFDLNAYPGDDALPLLKKTFSFASYWLSAPPGEKSSSWTGKRKLLEHQGFGFVVLFNALESREVKSMQVARAKGILDAQRASKLAAQEGFPAGTVIFLDVEEGGRLPATYQTYLQTWFESLAANGFRAGVYCSGIPVDEGHGVRITSAQDIQSHAGSTKIVYWVFNDSCPPSPGCTFPKTPASPSTSGTDFAAVWQYAQTPMRKERTEHCRATYAPDGNCYAPGDQQHKWFLDANVASTPDPSSTK
jgi:hypothetical protein